MAKRYKCTDCRHYSEFSEDDIKETDVCKAVLENDENWGGFGDPGCATDATISVKVSVECQCAEASSSDSEDDDSDSDSDSCNCSSPISVNVSARISNVTLTETYTVDEFDLDEFNVLSENEFRHLESDYGNLMEHEYMLLKELYDDDEFTRDLGVLDVALASSSLSVAASSVSSASASVASLNTVIPSSLVTLPVSIRPLIGEHITPPLVTLFTGERLSLGLILCRVVDSATRTIDGAIYTLTSTDITSAFVRARDRGVIVRLVVDRGQAQSKYMKPQLTVLRQGGVSMKEVSGTGTHGLMHLKFLIVDGICRVKGTFNWTLTASQSSHEDLDVSVCVTSTQKYGTKFTTMWNAVQ
jgi:hypothetical protein